MNFETTAHDFTISEEQYLAAKNELENLYNEKIEGQILRSKVQWYEDGEKSSKFFLNLEKKKGIQNTVRTLISDDGNELVENKAILKKIKDFYKTLFSKKIIQSDNLRDQFLEGLNLAKITSNERLSCDIEINCEDLKTSLHSMENGRSPGIDGLTREFYITFWESISEPLFESFCDAKIKGI